MTEIMPEEDARVIGQAMLDLAARMPAECVDVGYGTMQSPVMLIAYEAADEVWEIEFTALDPVRNFTLKDPSLEVVMRRALERDRKAAADV